LIKHTFPEHSDYENLLRALEKVKKMNQEVDQKKKEIDIKKEFREIQQRQFKRNNNNFTTFTDFKDFLSKKVAEQPPHLSFFY